MKIHPIKSFKNRCNHISRHFSQGSVLIFLDAHVEVTGGWLQPLLTSIANDRSTIATPHINWIEPRDFSYIEIAYSTGSFIGLNWFLNFTW